MQRNSRMKKELSRMEKSPPPGVSLWPVSDRLDQLEAIVLGPEDSPYAGGAFKLDVTVPERYPFEPPVVNFRTKIYHPNIDGDGRICIDILKVQPQGDWKPSRDLASVLTSLRLLMAEPNPGDPLMADIAQEFQFSPVAFREKARSMTQLHATRGQQDDVGKRKADDLDEGAPVKRQA